MTNPASVQNFTTHRHSVATRSSILKLNSDANSASSPILIPLLVSAACFSYFCLPHASVKSQQKHQQQEQQRKKTSTESTHFFIDSESQCRAPWILPSWTLFFGDRLPWARCTPQLSTDGLSRDEFSAAKRVTTTFHQWRNGRGCDASVFFVHKKGAFHLFCPSENMCCFSCEKMMVFFSSEFHVFFHCHASIFSFGDVFRQHNTFSCWIPCGGFFHKKTKNHHPNSKKTKKKLDTRNVHHLRTKHTLFSGEIHTRQMGDGPPNLSQMRDTSFAMWKCPKFLTTSRPDFHRKPKAVAQQKNPRSFYKRYRIFLTNHKKIPGGKLNQKICKCKLQNKTNLSKAFGNMLVQWHLFFFRDFFLDAPIFFLPT